MDAEVSVAAEEVGEEPDADGERDELPGERDQRAFAFREKRAGAFEVAAGERFEHRHPHLDLREVQLVFERRAGRCAHHVAEIIERAAGHHGVEVHDAHRLAGDDVEHDVVKLRVVVRDALGDFLLRQGVQDHIDVLLLLECERDLLLRLAGAVGVVRLDRLLKRFEAMTCVVKVWNRFREPLARQIDQELLELAKCLARLKGLRRCFHRLKCPHAIHEHQSAPAFAVAVAVIRTVVARRDDGERSTRGIARAGFGKLAPLVRSHADEVIHQRLRVLEHMRVDPLVDIAHLHAALVVGGDVGLVDVANLARLGMEQVAVDLKMARDFEKF